MVEHVYAPSTPTFVLPQRFKDFIGGTVAGIATKFFEHPADTVKVRLQTNPSLVGPSDCFRQTLRNEGVRALFRGITAPMFGSAAENAIAFITFEEVKRHLRRHPDEVLPLHRVAVAGAASGIAMSFWLTPIELLKCRQQTDTANLYRGTFDCARQTIRSEGLRAFYKGHLASMLREGPGNAFWFAGYEGTCRLLTRAGETPSSLAVITAGSVAGVSFWAVAFPMDTVKSRMQVSTQRLSFSRVLVDMVRVEGPRSLYAGLGLTLVRAVPSNAVLFLAFDTVSRLLKGV